MDVDELEAAADDLLAIERATVSAVAAILSKPFKRLLALAVALWPGDSASPAAKRRVLSRLNSGVLVQYMPLVRQRIKQGGREALEHGLTWALREAEDAGATSPKLPPSAYHLSPELHARTDALEAVARSKAGKAQPLLMAAATLDDMVAALAVIQQTESSAKRMAAYVANQAANESLTTVSHAVDELVSVWRAERDACVHCLAYQGRIDTGKGYPGGLTFGKTPLSTEPVAMPPLHYNCRCTQWLVHRDVVEPLAMALMREAKRSVLRGWSLESESEAVRLDAANRLLKRGSTLPKSVKEYAERSVRRGEFGRGRKPPV